DLAGRAAPDLLLLAAASRDGDGDRLLPEQLDPVGLDEDVDHERATGLLLTVEAVTAMDEERLRRQAVADRAARATAGQAGTRHRAHRMSSRTIGSNCLPRRVSRYSTAGGRVSSTCRSSTPASTSSASRAVDRRVQDRQRPTPFEEVRRAANLLGNRTRPPAAHGLAWARAQARAP